jgi:hypothetical protein
MDCRQQNVGYDTGIINQRVIFKHLVFQKVGMIYNTIYDESEVDIVNNS